LATFYADLASDTGGTVKLISDDSSDIVEAILAALEELKTDVWWETDCGPELSISLTPDVQYQVEGGTTIEFAETIFVPNNTAPGDYTCTVTFYANTYPDEGVFLGEEEIKIKVVPIPVPFDLKPTSCRNPLNMNSQGALPAAILGTTDFDVTQVDPASVRLNGIAPLRWAQEDVATPYEPFIGKEDAFDCTEDGPDGYMDLTLKFDIQEVVAVLGDVEDGDVLVLTLTANLLDGRAIEGEDVIVILKKGK
jgi:hypothetical protein